MTGLNGRRVSRVRLAAGLAVAVAVLGMSEGVASAQGPPDPADGVEVLTRGPVHEAFAPTVTYDPEPGIVVPRPPPDPIDELPPERRPAGDNVEWIPGYWAWDDEVEDFLWISGLWRNLPPGRQWVSGYWGRSRQGAQWTSGYWADARLTEVEYLPEPPQSAEAGPNVAAPSDDHLWVPGGWVWQQNRYAWRPGFWSMVQPNWAWTPAHYLWSPRGYVHVDGYWDYEVARRGVLFAPVSFRQNVYSQRGFSYTPATVIDLAVFANHLFLRPNYGHYYYGDYYAANYAGAGFHSSHSFHSGHHGYDPIYAHQRWHHRQDRDWERRMQAAFQHRRDHEPARPPRTFAAQRELRLRGLAEQDRERVFAQPFEDYTTSRDAPVRFRPLNEEDRQRFGRLGQQVRMHREERQKREAEAAAPTAGRSARQRQPARVSLPRSPVVATEFGKDQVLPQHNQAPEIDPTVEPRPRQARGGRPAAPANPNVVKPQQQDRQGQPRGRSGGQPPAASSDQPRTNPPSESGEKPRGASDDNRKDASPAKPRGRSQDKPNTKPEK